MTMDVTPIFWDFIHMTKNMNYYSLSNTTQFEAIKEAVHKNSAFKMDVNSLHNFDIDSAMPKNTCTDGVWIYFKDVNALFFGMKDIYAVCAPESTNLRTLSDAIHKMQIWGEIHDVADIFDAMRLR
jgi:hypothetical protein